MSYSRQDQSREGSSIRDLASFASTPSLLPHLTPTPLGGWRALCCSGAFGLGNRRHRAVPPRPTTVPRSMGVEEEHDGEEQRRPLLSSAPPGRFRSIRRRCRQRRRGVQIVCSRSHPVRPVPSSDSSVGTSFLQPRRTSTSSSTSSWAGAALRCCAAVAGAGKGPR